MREITLTLHGKVYMRESQATNETRLEALGRCQMELDELKRDLKTTMASQAESQKRGPASTTVQSETTPHVPVDAKPPPEVTTEKEDFSESLKREREAINVELEALRGAIARVEKDAAEDVKSRSKRWESYQTQVDIIVNTQEAQEQNITALRKEMEIVKADYMYRANLHAQAQS